MRVAFCHPDLGLGGAERLIVDAAVELVGHGHQVDLYTAHHDPSRCFQETVDGTFRVVVAGGWFPRHFWGLGHAFCAYIRCLLTAFHLAHVALRQGMQYDVIIVDQVAVVIPLFRALTSSRVLFYCHFPDLLLVRRRSRLRAAYRAPLNWLEEITTGMADRVLVNSAYTRGMFASTFKRLDARRVVPGVLHPCCRVPSLQQLAEAKACWRSLLPGGLVAWLQGPAPTFLSINRFERKKDVGLAVRALAELSQQTSHRAQRGSSPADGGSRLVLAGGYDPRLAENREYFQEMRELVAQLGLQERVWMLPSFTDEQRAGLLAICRAVVYTPQNEHFGIVPLEAMAASRPVVACDSGGPTESVPHRKGGFLAKPTAAAFADAMAQLLDRDKAEAMGRLARQHVQQCFSRQAFGNKLDKIVRDMAQRVP